MFFALYLISICSGIKFIFITFGILSFVLFFIYSLRITINPKEFKKKYRTKMKNLFYRSTLISMIVVFTGLLVPTSKDALIIFSVNKLSKSEIFENANSITKKSLKLLESKLDDYLRKDKKDIEIEIN